VPALALLLLWELGKLIVRRSAGPRPSSPLKGDTPGQGRR
jgi:hypothetical protein